MNQNIAYMRESFWTSQRETQNVIVYMGHYQKTRTFLLLRN